MVQLLEHIVGRLRHCYLVRERGRKREREGEGEGERERERERGESGYEMR